MQRKEKALRQRLTSAEYRLSILRAFHDEAAGRAAAVESPPTTIEVMSDDDNGDTRAPRPYRRVKPQYPEAAAQAQVEATVDVSVDIDARGEISHLEIARWAGYGLDQSVIDTVKQMHFFPAMRDGQVRCASCCATTFAAQRLDRSAGETLKIPRPND